MPSVEAAGAAGRVLRTTGDAYRVTASYTRKYEPDLTLYITMTVTIGFISFEYNFLD